MYLKWKICIVPLLSGAVDFILNYFFHVLFFDLQRKVVHPLAIVEATFLLPSTRIVRKTVNMRDVARQAYMKKHSSYNDLFDLSCLYKQEEKLIHPSRAVRRHSFSHSSFG